MIDEKYNPFLIESDTNPGFEFNSLLIRMLLLRLIDDIFILTINQVYFRNVFAIKYFGKGQFIFL